MEGIGMRWAEVTVDTEPAAIDAVGYCLTEIGCAGFVVRDEDPPVRVSGYIPVDDRLESRLDQLQSSLNNLESFGVEGVSTGLTLKYVDEDDWANAWKAF